MTHLTFAISRQTPSFFPSPSTNPPNFAQKTSMRQTIPTCLIALVFIPRIFSVTTGRLFWRGKVQPETGILLNEIPNGIYMLRIQNEHESIVLKGIKR